MPTIPARLLELGHTDRLQVEAWLAEFEEGWDEHCLAARVERLPPPGAPLRLPALIELVKIDLERNWQCGRRVTVADYLVRYPELGPAETLPSDLVQAEKEVGRQFGELAHTLPTAPDNATGSSTPLESAAPAPSRVPCVRGYDVLGKLGQGGMGAVYKARDLQLGRIVALKVVSDGANARPADLVRFLQEAEMIARLQHPNIVQIYEVGEYAGGSYLALEYVEGPALDRKVNGAPQPPPEAARLVEVLARAVHYAHGQGVIHRDLKPANVLLTSAGAPKITDFGLARHIELESGLTTAGAIMGTPSYMAPEQAEGRPKHLGPHTDTYALGAILYECLTGRPPFQAATVLDTLRQVSGQDPVPPHRLLGSSRRVCPADLETICLKCLEKDPQRRYASAGALADDLGRYLAGAPIAARPVGPTGRAWRWARRNPGWAGMLATLAGLLLLIAVGSSVLSLWLGEALQQSQDEKRKADENLWVALLEQARGKSRSRERGQRFDGLAAIRQALKLPVPPGRSLAELRNEAIACMVLPDVEPAGEWWEGAPTGTDRIAFDPTCERYARADTDGNVSVRRVANDAEIIDLKGWGKVEALSFSPDGHFLHHRGSGRLKLYRLDGAAAQFVLEDATSTDGTGVAYSPDGRFFATCQHDGSVAVYDLQSAKPDKDKRRLLTGLRPLHVAFRPGVAQLAVAGGVVRVFDLNGKRAFPRDLSQPYGVLSMAWHPDGRILATTCSDRRIRLWDVATGKIVLPPLAGHVQQGMEVAFHPAGDCLLSNDWGGTMRLWDPGTGRQLFRMQSAATAFSRDGTLLAFDRSDTRVRLLRAATRRPLRALVLITDTGNQQDVWDARVSLDGQLLFVTRPDALTIVDWATGAKLASASLNLAATRVVGYDSEGGLLTGGPRGLLRWPVRTEPMARRLHIGPPESLYNSDIWYPPSCSADGRVIAIPAIRVGKETGALVLHRPDNRRVKLGPREDVRNCSVSPDGHWVATGNHWNTRGIAATVWDAQSGQAVANFPMASEGCGVGFSPADGKWLLTTGVRFRLWRVGTWDEGPAIARPDDQPGDGFAFASDGRLLALASGISRVRLVDPDSGAEIARLTVPEQTLMRPQCFSPDGSHLVAVGHDTNLIYIWDLRALRAELKELGLDWEAPPYPEPVQAAPAPLEVRLINPPLPKRTVPMP